MRIIELNKNLSKYYKMYIHLLQFQNLPDYIYKVILTNDDSDVVKKIHELFYTVMNVYTFEIDDIKPELFSHILELAHSYDNHKYFIYCHDLNSFEKMIYNVEQLDEFLDNISTKKTPLTLTKKESKKIYEIIKFFIDESSKEHLFISEKSLYNLKNYDDNIHEIYLDDNSTIYCVDQQDKQEFEEKLIYVTVLDGHIYLSESKEKFIQIDDTQFDDEIFGHLNARELSAMIDSKDVTTKRSTPICNTTRDQSIVDSAIKRMLCDETRKEILPTDIRGLSAVQSQFTAIAKNYVKYDNFVEADIEPYNQHDAQGEPIISKNVCYDHKIGNESNKYEELKKNREDRDYLFKIPTTIQGTNEKVNPEYKLYDDIIKESFINEEPIEQIIDDDNNDGNIILFMKNSILDKNIISYDSDEIDIIKNCKYISEIETVAEYVVPELDAVRGLLEIKLKKIDKLTFNIVEKIIMKINEFLYGDDVKQSRRIMNTSDNKSEQMISLVRDFLLKNCIRKVGSKIYSNELFNKFSEYLMGTSPTNIVYFNKNNFTPLIKKFNYKTKRDGLGIYWMNMCYKNDSTNTFDKYGGRWFMM